jgi:hypothetical protein
MTPRTVAPNEDVRTTVAQAVAPLERTVRELQLRLQELERRAPTPSVYSSSPGGASAPPEIAAPAPMPAPPPAWAPGAVAAQARPILEARNTKPTEARGLDVAAIERTVQLDPEMQALDGSRRRLRLLLGIAFVLLVGFAGLFAALAESYTHAHR